MKGPDVKSVREVARGRWGEILAALAPDLGEAVAAFPRHVACPQHGGRDGFRLFRDYEDTGGGICNTCGTFSDGFALLRWVNDWSFPQTVEQVAEHLGVDPEYELDPVLDSGMGYVEDTANRLRIDMLWRETMPDNGIISNYLKSRGLSGRVPLGLRLHPDLPFYTREGVVTGTFPAMCAPVQNGQGKMVSIHRTYLSPDGSGKADVEQAKKLLPPVYPGAASAAHIRLGPIQSHINLTEGIETGLAVQEKTLVPTLAAISAGGLERFQPPAGVRTIEIWADNDISEAGQRSSARALRALTAQGYIVAVSLSPEPGTDWLDTFHPA